MAARRITIERLGFLLCIGLIGGPTSKVTAGQGSNGMSSRSDIDGENATGHPTYNQDDGDSELCRYWEGYVEPTYYKETTCAFCYGYLFPGRELRPFQKFLVSTNGTVFPHMTFVVPDIENQTIVDKVCLTLKSSVFCDLWIQCCHEAEDCCKFQLDKKPKKAIGGGGSREASCPATWDGYACWDDGVAGEVVQKSCPGFIPYGAPETSYKTCTENGTWFEKKGKEWTDYTACLDVEDTKIVIFIKLACDGLSLMALIPSLVIFLGYRTLRKQHRVRLHINLFFSFVLFAVINMLWEILVVYDKMNKPSGENTSRETLMGNNAAFPGFPLQFTAY